MVKGVLSMISGKYWNVWFGYSEPVYPGKTCRNVTHPARPATAGSRLG